MLACLSSLKSCHVHADHHDCKVLTNAGTEVEIPTQGRRALPPHLKKKIHFSLDIFILNCYCGWKVCTWCVFDVFRDWNVCQRWLRSAKVKGSCKEKNGHHYLHINLYPSCYIYIYIYIYQLTDTTVDPSLVHFNLRGICKHFNQWTLVSPKSQISLRNCQI